jgi:hypothetical protein
VCVDVPIQPTRVHPIVVWSTDRSRSGFSASLVVRSIDTRVVWFSSPIFLINWEKFGKVSFHRPLKKELFGIPKLCTDITKF